MNDIFFKLFEALIIAIMAVVARYVVPFVKDQISHSQFAWAIDVAQTAVSAIEQQMGGKEFGQAKKSAAESLIKQILTEYNIAITDTQIDALIEAAVKSMNDEKKNQ